MKALITGITGFVGSHLADFLLNQDAQVVGLTRWRSPKENILHLLDDVVLEHGDLLDFSSLYQILDKHRPDVIYHLAAQSYVPYSFRAPATTLDVNVVGTCNLLESVRLLRSDDFDPIIHVCSSSEVYGQVLENEVPIKETNPLRPASPYAVSKVAEDMLAYQYWRSWGMKIIRTRLFTHSVSKWTPVMVRDSVSGLMDVVYISEIRQAQKSGGYLSGILLDDGTQLWSMDRHNLEVWNDGHWSKIKHVSCHPINDAKMLEVSTRSGVILVTDNHSMVDKDGHEVCAADLEVGSEVKITGMPNVEITELDEDAAWLYGFFVAEGDTSGGRLRIANKKIDLLEKSQAILLKHFAVDSVIREEKNEVFRLSIRKPYRLSKLFKEDCYATDKNKKIPKIILNANKQTKLSFLRGFNLGDGDTSGRVKSEFYRFKTKSPILACGLCYLVESAVGVPYKIHVEKRGLERYFEIRCLSQTGSQKGNHLIKNGFQITSIDTVDYEDEVWDFETENHWFSAGIGGIIVHNTGPRRGDVFVVSNFAKQIAEIEAGKREPVISVGNLDSIRTFMDVRDAVRAYWLLISKCPPGEVYNVGGKVTMTVGDMLNKLIQLSIRDDIEVSVDPARLRPSDVTLQIPCTDKFHSITGWEPEIDFGTTLRDTLDYWRNWVNGI